MFKKTLLAGAALALSFGASAGPNKGDFEILFSNAGGTISSPEDGDTSFALGAQVGYFLTQRHEIGGGLAFTDLGVPGTDSWIDLEAFYRYNAMDNGDKNWWYFGVDLEFPMADDNFAKPTYLRPHVGHKWMLSDDIAFDINLGYGEPIQDAEIEVLGTTVEYDPGYDLDLQFGFSIFF